MAKSLSDINTEVTERLGDSVRELWSSAEIDGYIKKGYNEFCLTTGILWRRTNTGLDDVAAQALYDLPTEIYSVERVSYKGFRIEPITKLEATAMDKQFQTQQGQVITYMLDGDGLRKLRKIRIPSVNGTSGDTQLEGFRRGADLSGANFEIPDYMTKYIRFFALWHCFEREGKGQDLKAAEHYKARYDRGVQLAVGRKEAVQANRLRVIGSGGEGYRGRVRPPKPVLPSNFPK